MKNSLTLGTRGKLSRGLKRSIVIASFGFIQLASGIPGPGPDPTPVPTVTPTSFVSWSRGSLEEVRDSKTDKKLEELKKLAIQQDDEEILLILKIFTQCL